MFNRIFNSAVSEDTGVKILQDILFRKAALGLSEQAYKVSTGTADVDSLQTHLDVLQGKQSTVLSDLEPISTNLEELLQDVYKRPGLRWRLNSLNKSLGSLRAGDFGFIFARPETGKTTFLASEIAFMLGQTDGNVCWFNNEEQGQKVILRVYQAYFGVTLEQLLSNVKKYQDEFIRASGGRLKFFDTATISRTQVERLVGVHSPRLVVYDQIDKIKGFAADREDLRLGGIYQWARELAKNRHSVIAVCQADGQAEGQKWLNMDHVSNAKTAKQAEADYIIGIGKIHDSAAEAVRFLNVSKNKLMGDQDSIPTMRHARLETLIEPDIARYRDVINYD